MYLLPLELARSLGQSAHEHAVIHYPITFSKWEILLSKWA